MIAAVAGSLAAAAAAFSSWRSSRAAEKSVAIAASTAKRPLLDVAWDLNRKEVGQAVIEGDPGHYRSWIRFAGKVIEVADIPTTLHRAEIKVVRMAEVADDFADHRIAPEQLRELEFEAVPNSQDVLLYSPRYEVPLTVTISDVLAKDSYLEEHVSNILVRLTYSNGRDPEVWLCRTVLKHFTQRGGLAGARTAPPPSPRNGILLADGDIRWR